MPQAKKTKQAYRRNLPHFNPMDRSVFVTFCTQNRWVLPEHVRQPVLNHCLHDHGTKLQMHAAIVMPDHVHLLFTPRKDSAGAPFGLAEILHGIKGASAHTVNRMLDHRGHVWQDESLDHVLRKDEDVVEKAHYICQNPIRRGMARSVDEYPWIWRDWVDLEAKR